MSGTYRRKDHLYQRAKEEGYRSRAAYKLIEMDERFHLFHPGTKVLDVGAWPGGWLQVASSKVGAQGLVVGVDLAEIESLQQQNVTTFNGDARDEEIQRQCLELAGGLFDLLLSDMSPKLSGIREADNAATTGIAALALELSCRMVRDGGNLVVKIFKSPDSGQFIKRAQTSFKAFHRVELDATRKTSNEYYFVGLGMRRAKMKQGEV